MIRITAYKDGETLGTGAYELERVCIGSAEKAHLRVEEEDVAPAHVEVWLENGKCWTRLLSFQMAWLNGEELEGEVELKAGDRLRVSSQIELTVSFEIQTAVPDSMKSTEITFKTYSDIMDSDDELPTSEPPKPSSRSSSRSSSYSSSRHVAAHPKNDTPKAKLSLKDKLIVFGMPAVVVFLFWWKVWPVVKKINGWK